MTDLPIIYSGAMVKALRADLKRMTRRLAWRPHWHLATTDDLPDRFTDPRCNHFRTICSNGFIGDISIGSAFVHKPRSYPQCFPVAEEDACCTSEVVRRFPSSWQKVRPGDRLWVRENFAVIEGGVIRDAAGGQMDAVETQVRYQADCRHGASRWKPSIHMPRWVSRITLEVTATKIEPLQQISRQDAVAEGVGIFPVSMSAQKRFQELWTTLHGADSWAANPEVVAISFTVVMANIDKA